jgi:hypothetical protein
MLSHYYIMFINIERTVQKQTIYLVVGCPIGSIRINKFNLYVAKMPGKRGVSC